MWFRVKRAFEHPGPRGKVASFAPGQLVDVLARHAAERLLRRGVIMPQVFSFEAAAKPQEPAHEAAVTKRVGIWLSTSSQYSGGRIHMFQYALCLGRLGVEVYLFTRGSPRWAQDYLDANLVTVVQLDDGGVPPDIDVIVTDSKTDLGRKAWQYKQQHPHVPFVCMNFETPNWVAQFAPEYAKKLTPPGTYTHFPKADMLMANSGESLKWCKEYISWDGGLCAVLPPAVNTDALAHPARTIKPRRPYALWCGRGSDFKGSDLACEAVWSLGREFDLVAFGTPRHVEHDTGQHQLHEYRGKSDAEKFALMAGAHMVLAPSTFEGFGMVPMEALASGTPCVVYDLPVLRQNYGDRLIYVPWKDRAAFKAKTAELAAAPKQDITAAKQWAVTTWGLPAMQKRIERIPYHAMKRVSVTAHMICYGTPTAVAAIEAVYAHVDQIVIAYGPTPEWKGWDDHGVLEQIRAMPDPKNKLQIEARELWNDKEEMRQWCVEQATGNYMMMLDADEIWTGLDQWIADPPPWGCPRWVTLWHGPGHWIFDHSANQGRRWGFRLEPYGSVCPHYRWSWWRPSFYMLKHHTPVDSERRVLVSVASNCDAAGRKPGTMIYHLGHAMPPELMRAKHAYYETRDGADPGRIARRKAWASWKGAVGPMQDGIVKEVTWELPAQVRRAFSLIQPVGASTG